MNVMSTILTPEGSPLRSSVISKPRQRLGTAVLLVAADVFTVAVAFLLANLPFLDYGFNNQGLRVLSVLIPLYVGLASANRAFEADLIDHPLGGASLALKSLIQAGAAILAIAYFLKIGVNFSRGVFGLGMGASSLLLVVQRTMARRWLRRWTGGVLYSTLVIRDGVDYGPIGDEVVMTPAQLGFDPSTSDPYEFHVLAHAVGDVDRLLVACPKECYALWSTVLKSMPLSGEIVTDEEDHIGIIGIGRLGDRRTMIVGAGPLSMNERIAKRALDLFVCCIGILLLSPVLIGVAIAIRLESRGPILFRQERIGEANRIFEILKFRSMYADLADQLGAQSTGRGDPRITRVGAFIRRTSIDELPQLFNVLKGEMSIVGPRPHPLECKADNMLFWDIDPRYRHRHSIKPGLTGLAQVRGFRGSTEQISDLTNRLQADLEYALDWSLWRDIKIIVRTLTVLRHQNAF